jgi:hypothetical protein
LRRPDGRPNARGVPNMTLISKLLKQRSALCERAVEQTRDVNEGYLVVHGVMARAFNRASDGEHDLGGSLTLALDEHSSRLAVVA